MMAIETVSDATAIGMTAVAESPARSIGSAVRA
jgi:hypothetical protein